MTLTKLIAECQKLDTPHKAALINKLKVCEAILVNVKGAEHLLETTSEVSEATEAKAETPVVTAPAKAQVSKSAAQDGPVKPLEPKAKPEVKRRPAEPMPKGG